MHKQKGMESTSLVQETVHTCKSLSQSTLLHLIKVALKKNGAGKADNILLVSQTKYTEINGNISNLEKLISYHLPSLDTNQTYNTLGLIFFKFSVITC